MGPIDHMGGKNGGQWGKSMGPINFCVQQKKESHTGLEQHDRIFIFG